MRSKHSNDHIKGNQVRKGGGEHPGTPLWRKHCSGYLALLLLVVLRNYSVAVVTFIGCLIIISVSFSRNRIIPKRINVRIEHVKHSRCREDFLRRVKENEEKRRVAKETGQKVNLKRQPVGPRPGHFVKTHGKEPELVEPIPYEFLA